MSRLYATFDETAANLGASLVLSDGDSVVKTTANVDAHRCARGTIYQDDFVSTVEFYIYSPDNTNPSLATVAGVPPLVVGIVRSSADKAKYVGEDQYGIGYAPDGNLYINGSATSLGVTYTYDDYIEMVLDKPNDTLVIKKNGVVVSSGVAIATNSNGGYAWTFAATVSGAAGTMAVKETSGGDAPIRYRDNNDVGWWSSVAGIQPVQVATEFYMTAATDTPRHEKYAGDLDNTSHALAISDGIGFWMFGQSAPAELRSAGGLVQFQINDRQRTATQDGQYARLLTDAARGERISFSVTQSNTAYSGASGVFAGIFDHASPDTMETVQCYARTMQDRLTVALRRALIPPGADPSSANKPFPMSLGVCRNYEPTLIDATNRIYAIHDGAIANFGTNREAGKPLVLGTDISITSDGGGVIYPSGHPIGKATIESTSFGPAFDPGSTDYLQNSNGHIGDFRSAVSLSPWTAGYFAAAGSLPTLIGSSPHKSVYIPNHADALGWIVENTIPMRAGYGYTFSINVLAVPYYGAVTGGTVPPANLLVGYIDSSALHFSHWARIPLTGAGDYTGFFINNTGSDQQLVVALECNAVLSSGTGLQFDQIYMNELPPVAANVDLDGPGLTQMIQALAVDRGPLDSQEVSTTESDAIDTATGYRYGLMVSPTDNPSIEECLQRTLDSCTAAKYFDGDGVLRVMRLTAPEDVADADVSFELSYERADFLSDLIPYPDFAENLSTRAQGCPNGSPFTDGDFGSTTLGDCPPNVRVKLKAQYQWTTSAGIALATRYQSKATLKEPHKTLLDREADGNDMIVQANSLYTSDRNFYVGDVWMPALRRRFIPDTSGGSYAWVSGDFQIGMCIKVTYPIGNLIAGKKLWLLGYSPKQPSLQKCRCIFWGL